MPRLSRSVTAACALLVAIVLAVAACSGASATKLTDPNEILTQGLTSTSNAKSVHMKVEINGQIKGDLMKQVTSGSSATGMKFDGTTIEGDADIAHNAAHITVSVPALLGLTVDLIEVDGALYMKNSMQGDKYTKSSLGAVVPGESLPIASASPNVKEMTDQLKKQLADNGIKPELKGTDQIAGKDAYHLSFPIPMDKLNASLGQAMPGMSIDSATVDAWIYVDGNRPAKFEIKGSAAVGGDLDAVITLTNYDKDVTIKAPDASQIQSGS